MIYVNIFLRHTVVSETFYVYITHLNRKMFFYLFNLEADIFKYATNFKSYGSLGGILWINNMLKLQNVYYNWFTFKADML